ncbi:molybdopterin-dependent oxidoreductase [Nocardia pseudovaccinii]|uniref:molybdopterin-dependent oxidoreductase n=1 Tax=Nocardia pseudovaccinii TaxID=189540 RepID=UPI003D8F257E
MQRISTSAHWGNYEAVVDGDRLLRLEPVADDPAPSPIGDGIVDALRDRTRIEVPMIRRGWLENGPRPADGRRGLDEFVEVSWDRAFDLAAAEIRRVRREHGDASIYGGSYGWASAGRFHHAQSQIHRFLNFGGGYTGSVGSYSFGAMEAILPHVIGGGPTSARDRQPMWPEIIEHGELVVSFGGLASKNAHVNAGGVGRHETPLMQRAARDAGVEFVNLSPVRTDADPNVDAQWLPLRPNTDVAAMLGIAHTMLASGIHDRDFLARCCTGFDQLDSYLHGLSDGIPKDAEWAAAITGLEARDIRDLAERIAARRTVINVSWSVQRYDHGEQTYWMAVVLSAMSGSMGKPGGGFAPGLGIAQTGMRPSRYPVAALPQGVNPVTMCIPVARIADMLLGPGETYQFNGKDLTYPDIRLVYWAGGNIWHHHQDLNRLFHAWQRPQTIIVHEHWWNPMARFADIVFPVATTLERTDFAVGMADLTVAVMQQVVAPPAEARTDYEVFAALADRLGYAAEFTEGRTAEEWVAELYRRTRDKLGQVGVQIPTWTELQERVRFELPEAPTPTAGSYALLREDPQANPFPTPSGRIELYSETVAGFGYDDCPPHPTWLEPHEWLGGPKSARHPLHLISSQPSVRLHSQLDNGLVSRNSKVSGREPIRLNPADADARGINDSDVVRVFNDRGCCLAGAIVTDAIRPGVVLITTGAWYDPTRPGDPNGLELHGNPNVLTPDRGTSRLAQATSSGSTLVEVEKYTGQAPEVGVFEPPTVVSERNPL